MDQQILYLFIFLSMAQIQYNKQIIIDIKTMRPQNNLIIDDGYDIVPKLKQSGYLIGQPLLSPSANPLRMPMELPSPSHHPYTSNDQVIVHPVPIPHSRNSSPNKSLKNSYISDNKNSSSTPYPPQPHVANFIYHTSNRTPEKYIVSPPRQVVNVNMVPYSEYQYYLQECRKWETKYIQLQNKYAVRNSMKTQELSSKTSSQQYNFLQSENAKLRQRIRELQKNQERVGQKMENMMVGLIQKSKQATIKEYILLADRFRLHNKAQGRYL